MGKTVQHSIILGFALFALYFGAGNLIFPPEIGHASGADYLPALLGFAVTGILLPLLAVIAVLNVGGKFEELTRPISPWFYKIFNLLLMVGIGVFVTLPRMGATTHEMGINVLFPSVPQLVTLVVYFAITFYFAMDKSNVIEKIGKWLTPALMLMLLIIVFKGFITPLGKPIETGITNPFSNAFISAYQTGDIITGILCAPIFIAAIYGFGYKGKDMRKMAIIGTVIAGVGLLIVYGGLLYIGSSVSGQYPADISSTAMIISFVETLLGGFGTTALAIAVALACLTSTIGVIAVIAEFLEGLTNGKIRYRTWVAIVCVLDVIIASFGVGNIVAYTMWIFTLLYPVAIVLVFLGVFKKFVPNAGVFRGSILFTVLVTVFETLAGFGLSFAQAFASSLPLSANGFAWLIPAILGGILGGMTHRFISKETRGVLTPSGD